jgi:hypothetical protein
MKSIFTIIMAGGMLFSVACKPKEKTTTTASNDRTKSSTTDKGTRTVTDANSINYRFIISFISKGSGVDGKAQDNMKAFLEKHPKNPAYDKIRWGREGEEDYCFLLKEFSTSEQVAFIADAKKVVSSSDLVNFSENQSRVKK